MDVDRSTIERRHLASRGQPRRGRGGISAALERILPKGYIYFAMGFAVFVEMLNLRLRRREVEPLQLRQSYVEVPVAPESAEGAPPSRQHADTTG